ncbi:MAG: sulfurtransferase TusA family protein [Deltaproteobacteria bacterium]|nr:sulfurtransferase TusA family protein [Deltaproteobacteria bacterium]
METIIKHKFDFRETFTPLIFLKVTQAFREMKVGEILQIKGDDPKTRREIFQVLNTFHYTIIDTEENGDYYCICLKKEN